MIWCLLLMIYSVQYLKIHNNYLNILSNNRKIKIECQCGLFDHQFVLACSRFLSWNSLLIIEKDSPHKRKAKNFSVRFYWLLSFSFTHYGSQRESEVTWIALLHQLRKSECVFTWSLFPEFLLHCLSTYKKRPLQPGCYFLLLHWLLSNLCWTRETAPYSHISL